MPKYEKIDIIIGNNSYSTVAHFSRSISKAFQRLGIKTRLFFVGKDNFYKAFYEIMHDPCDLTFSFSNVASNDVSLGAKWTIPHFSYLLDPGIYYLHQLEGHRCFVSCIDRKDIQTMHRLKPNHQPPFFLPHGVDQALFSQERQNKLYDLVFMGTCHDFDQIRASWKDKFNHETHKLLDMAQEMVLSPLGISCFEALWQLCGHIPQMSQHLTILHRELDLYVTGKERVSLLKTLEGPSLHIFGKGPWKKYISQATIHPPVAFSKALKIFSQSKIVINSSPRFKDGSHERPLISLALQALPLTGENPYFMEHFEDEKSLLFYQYGSYETLQEKIHRYLKNSDLCEEIIDRGRALTLKQHTWDTRALMLMKSIE